MRRIGPAAATATGDLVTVKALRECETNAPEKAYTVESAGPATGKLGARLLRGLERNREGPQR